MRDAKADGAMLFAVAAEVSRRENCTISVAIEGVEATWPADDERLEPPGRVGVAMRLTQLTEDAAAWVRDERRRAGW